MSDKNKLSEKEMKKIATNVELMQFLSPQSLATRLDIDVSSVWRKVKEGILPEPSYKMGEKCPRWNKDDIDAIMV